MAFGARVGQPLPEAGAPECRFTNRRHAAVNFDADSPASIEIRIRIPP
jgi:hypothetical protein